MEGQLQGDLLKIAFDHQIFSIQGYGGISRYFYELARLIPLVEDGGAEARVIAPLYANEYLKRGSGLSKLSGLYVKQLPYTRKIIRWANHLLSPFEFAKYCPDVIHETYYSAGALGAKDVARILTVYDMIHELFPGNFSSRDSTRRNKKIAIDRADHIICISENTRRDLIRLLDVDPNKISVVYLGHSLAVAETRCAEGARSPYLLYVGSRSDYKNFSGFIEAYGGSQFLRNNVNVVAFGGGAFTDSERALFRKNQVSDNSISQIGGGDDLLAEYYRDAALFVYPSLYEGFGIPPLEAMSHGCPVVCSGTSSIPEVVGDAAVLFDPYSVDSMMECIERTLIDSRARESMSSKGFERIQAFSWEKCAKETLDVYKEAR